MKRKKEAENTDILFFPRGKPNCFLSVAELQSAGISRDDEKFISFLIYEYLREWILYDPYFYMSWEFDDSGSTILVYYAVV